MEWSCCPWEPERQGCSTRILLGRADGFALGALLAACVSDADLPRRRERAFEALFAGLGFAAFLYLAVGVLLKGGPAFLGPEMAWPGMTLLALNLLFFAVVGLVFMRAGHPLLMPLRISWLVYLGQISYGIYLYHFLIFAALSGVCDMYGLGNGPAVKIVRWILLIAVPTISWEMLEKPILSLKDRFAGYTKSQVHDPLRNSNVQIAVGTPGR